MSEPEDRAKVSAPMPVRMLRSEDQRSAFPLYVVWELTMKCDQPCQHCGTRAGHARPVELETEVILDVAKSLARLGTREVTLIGGEAYNWTAHTTLGKPGNNPFCYHRVTQLRRKGVRERLVPVERAPGKPYDHGRFEIEVEPWPTDGT